MISEALRWGMLGAAVTFALTLLGGCGDEENKGDLADSVAGPGVEVNCAEVMRPGVGDTRIEVQCERAQP